MPDQLTNREAPVQTPNGQSAQASGQSQPPSAGSEQMVREADLRALKSKLDKQIAAERSVNGTLMARLQALESQLQQATTRGMDEDELRSYQLQQREMAVQQQWQMIQQQQQDTAKYNLFRRISAIHGIPIEELENAEGPDSAWEMGASYSRNKLEEETERRATDKVAKRESAADVDIDSGSPPGEQGSYMDLYQKGDARGFILKRLKDNRN